VFPVIRVFRIFLFFHDTKKSKEKIVLFEGSNEKNILRFIFFEIWRLLNLISLNFSL